MKHFLRSRKKVLLGLLISFAAFNAFVLVIFHLRFGNPLLLVLKIPFALLIPSFWPQDNTLLLYNILITLLPLAGVVFALAQPRNANMVAVMHISLVLYWMQVFYSINP
jgi:hypothetical protein